MSGDDGADEAARLETALHRIAHAAARSALHDAPPRATTPADVPDSALIAARLDALIADVRGALGTEG